MVGFVVLDFHVFTGARLWDFFQLFLKELFARDWNAQKSVLAHLLTRRAKHDCISKNRDTNQIPDILLEQ